jgi:hypothetical protein
MPRGLRRIPFLKECKSEGGGAERLKLRWIYSVNAGIERREVFIECW